MKKLIQMLFNKKPAADASVHPTPKRTPYELIGGEAATRQLANRFYDIMATAPQAAELYAIHPLPLDAIRQKFFEFLSGWLGGPALFEEKYGHPRLRMRHMPFPVTPQLRDQWMFCMNKALEEVVADPLLRGGLTEALTQLATHMINRES
jgi:hemoglobin